MYCIITQELSQNQDGTDLVTVKSYIIKCRKVNLSDI